MKKRGKMANDGGLQIYSKKNKKSLHGDEVQLLGKNMATICINLKRNDLHQ